MQTSLTNEQQVTLTVKPFSAKGKPAPVEGAPFWSSSNVNVATLVVAPDGLSAVVTAVGVGTSTVTVAADADLTAGVNQISTSVDVVVTAAAAASLSLTVGTPVDAP